MAPILLLRLSLLDGRGVLRSSIILAGLIPEARSDFSEPISWGGDDTWVLFAGLCCRLGLKLLAEENDGVRLGRVFDGRLE
jgi:hypothetical protein